MERTLEIKESKIIDNTDIQHKQMVDAMALLAETFNINKVPVGIGLSALLNTFCDFCHKSNMKKEGFVELCAKAFETTNPNAQG